MFYIITDKSINRVYNYNDYTELVKYYESNDIKYKIKKAYEFIELYELLDIKKELSKNHDQAII